MPSRGSTKVCRVLVGRTTPRDQWRLIGEGSASGWPGMARVDLI
jgi:hypothetical protein